MTSHNRQDFQVTQWALRIAAAARAAALHDAEEELLRLAEDPALDIAHLSGLHLGASAMRRLRDSPVITVAEPEAAPCES